MGFLLTPKTADEAWKQIVSLLSLHLDLFFLGLASVCLIGAIILGSIWLVLSAIQSISN